jgi:hypothetical protein
VFAVVCLAGLWFADRFVPETKGRTFAEIDAELRGRSGGGPSPAAAEAG